MSRMDEILEAAVDPATKDFNYDVLRGDEMNSGSGADLTARLSELIMTFPMMADRRVVVIRNFDSIRKDRKKAVSGVIAKTPESTLVVVEGEKAKLSPKPKTGLLSETFKPVYENRLPGWLRDRFRARGKSVEDGVIGLLINNVGTVLRELDSEIGKIIIASQGEERITEEAAARVVGQFKRDTVYGLCNAVGLGNLELAAKILTNLIETEPNKETYFLSSIISHIAKLGEYNRLAGEGTPHSEAMKTVTHSPYLWKLNRYNEQAKHFSPGRAGRAMKFLCRTDSMIKKSSLDNRLFLEIALPFITPRSKTA